MCKNAEAQDYANWSDKWLNLISERTSKLSADQKVKVLCPRGEDNDWNIIMNGPRPALRLLAHDTHLFCL